MSDKQLEIKELYEQLGRSVIKLSQFQTAANNEQQTANQLGGLIAQKEAEIEAEKAQGLKVDLSEYPQVEITGQDLSVKSNGKVGSVKA